MVKETSEASRGLVGLASLAKNLNSRSSVTTAGSSAGPSDLSKPKSDQTTPNNRPAATKPAGTETKSSPSSSWGGSGAFSATRPTTLVGKMEPAPSLGKSGKTVALVAGPAKSSTAATSGSSGTVAITTSSTVKMSQSTLMNADKRLQNMKKKAKLAEKRPR